MSTAEREAFIQQERAKWDMRIKSRRMIFPYTIGAKLEQFPWRWNWHNSRMFRQCTYTMPVLFVLFYQLQKFFNQDWNKQEWAERRAKRVNHWFDPVKDD